MRLTEFNLTSTLISSHFISLLLSVPPFAGYQSGLYNVHPAERGELLELSCSRRKPWKMPAIKLKMLVKVDTTHLHTHRHTLTHTDTPTKKGFSLFNARGGETDPSKRMVANMATDWQRSVSVARSHTACVPPFSFSCSRKCAFYASVTHWRPAEVVYLMCSWRRRHRRVH